ncbi:MAG: hypothetical protein IPG47_15675 [Thermoflexaceae bacterium]|nr:hypothetical protein [Thermoflexaceae bacterium]
MTPLASRVVRLADQERMFRHSRGVLAAVSGGPDSVALLLVLLELRERFGLTVQACHFDHQLRPESRADLEFVRDLCARLNVPCFTGEGDVRSVARQQRRSIEDTARMMRYQFLGFVAAEKQADCVAASALRGRRRWRCARPPAWSPASMPPTRSTPGDAEPGSRDAAARAPGRESLGRRGAPRVGRERTRGVRGQSSAQQRRQPGHARPGRRHLRPAALRPLQAEALTLVIEREAAFSKLEPEVNRTRLENARRVSRQWKRRGAFGQAVLQVSCGRVRIGPPLEPEPFDAKVLNVPGATLAGQWRVEVSTSELAAQRGASLTTVDANRVRGVLRVRPLVSGDRMTYHGIDRKVADVFANGKVPVWERLGALAITDSHAVHAVLTAGGTFEADPSEDADPTTCASVASRAVRSGAADAYGRDFDQHPVVVAGVAPFRERLGRLRFAVVERREPGREFKAALVQHLRGAFDGHPRLGHAHRLLDGERDAAIAADVADFLDVARGEDARLLPVPFEPDGDGGGRAGGGKGRELGDAHLA